MSKLVEEIHEAAAQYRLKTALEPNLVKMHPLTRIELYRQLGKDVVNDTVEVAGCRVVASLTCPKGHMLMVRDES